MTLLPFHLSRRLVRNSISNSFGRPSQISHFFSPTCPGRSFHATSKMLDQPIPVSQGTYKWHEFTENLECYEKGGYHPVHIGQTYGNGRYEIVHKLGYGSYSTVWLARTSTSSSDFVTLKILRADASDPEHECTILTNLSSPLGTCHPGYRHIQHLLDHFYIDGPNGKHMCLVTEVLGGSIGSSKASIPWKFSPDVARAIVVQVLRGLAYIHSRGVVHAGKSAPLFWS